VQTSRSTGINDSTSIHIKTTFEFNGDGLVTEKQVRNETRMGDSLIAYTTEEAFVYNVYHQIEKSTQSTVLDGVAVTVTRQFTYVTPSSNLIAKIETLEESGKSTADGGLLKDEKQSSNTVYVYDQADRISSILTSRNSASASKTTYKRKFKN